MKTISICFIVTKPLSEQETTCKLKVFPFNFCGVAQQPCKSKFLKEGLSCFEKSVLYLVMTRFARLKHFHIAWLLYL